VFTCSVLATEFGFYEACLIHCSRYYYTQFVGDPNDRPTIRGKHEFIGIALIDTDVYIPNGDGNEWSVISTRINSLIDPNVEAGTLIKTNSIVRFETSFSI
jgi:hypothetical protein